MAVAGRARVGAAERTEAAKDRRRLGILSAGHAVVDSYGQSLLSPLFPVLAAQLALSKAQVGALPMVMGLSASLGQPLLGYLSDRYPRICMVALGPAIAAVFCTLIGYAPGYHGLLLFLFLAGLGIGAFHPQGASLARQAAGGRGLAMALFTVGGNVGFGLAPMIGALGARLLGLHHFYWLAIPGLLYAGVLWKVFGVPALCERYRIENVKTRASEEREGERRNRSRIASRSSLTSRLRVLIPIRRTQETVALGFLTASVMVRAAVQVGIITFLPFYLPARGFAGMSPEAARGMAASIFLLANAVGGPLGGHLSDRLGGRTVMLGTFLLAPWPLFFAFHAPGYGCLAGLALGGFLLTMPHPANVVMAQELMPHRAGVAASMITGLAWGLAQVLALPLGGLADRVGVPLTLQLLSLLPLVGIALTLPVPERRS
jgi:FSR family fosmidomycin resistance protein-like MFS transporter